ncbi:MAG: LytTR family DNA-binding domain-containing protein [Bryobacteraceae bacterium]
MMALIADDEPIARQVLGELLEEFPDVRIAGEADSGPSAVEQIQRLRPDVVFLDLEMPGLDGFAVLRTLRRDANPLVVFVTAYQQHALEAFDAGAVDYLLKPVHRDRLSAALDKVRAQLRGVSNAQSTLTEKHAARKIVAKLGQDLHLLEPSEVIAFEAEGELVHIVTAGRRFLASHSLRALEEKLDRPRFRRVHRKTIVNTDHIRKISPLSSKRWLLKMSNGMEVVVSKRLAGEIREEMRW